MMETTLVAIDRARADSRAFNDLPPGAGCPGIASLAASAATRRERATVLAHLAGLAGATGYLLLETTEGGALPGTTLLAGDWPLDLVESLGTTALEAIARSTSGAGCTALPPTMIARDGQLDLADASAISEAGIGALLTVAVPAATRRFRFILSFAEPASPCAATLARIRLLVGYLASGLAEPSIATGEDCAISERERDCLRWVAEGKTTDEAATILGVSANTVNRYLTHAMQKLSARNRVMAVTTAIRRGLL